MIFSNCLLSSRSSVSSHNCLKPLWAANTFHNLELTSAPTGVDLRFISQLSTLNHQLSPVSLVLIFFSLKLGGMKDFL